MIEHDGYEGLPFERLGMHNPKTGQYLVIFGVSHIAPLERYLGLEREVADLHRQGFSLHLEGVTTSKKSLDKVSRRGKSKSAYRYIAKHLGWAVQRITYLDDAGNPIPFEVHDIVASDLPLRLRLAMRCARPVIFAASVVACKFMDRDSIVSVFESLESDKAEIAEQNSHLGSDDAKMFGVKIADRERIAADAVLAASPSSVMMVWGKKHLPRFERLFKSEGFVTVDQRMVSVVQR